MTHTRTVYRMALLGLVLLGILVLSQAGIARAAAPTELFFSEYIEGSSNNKALEIHNGTGAAVDLSSGGYNVQMFFNGSSSAGLTINLLGTVANGDVFVLAQSSANATILAQADQTNGAGWFNGDDAVVLRKGTTVIDSIGQVGFDPGSEWGSGLTSTADNTLQRQNTICAGDANTADQFDPATEWNGFAADTFTGLGSHTANCVPIDPAINEFSASTAGTDVEFVELYAAPNADLSGFTVLEIEGDSGTSVGTVDEVIALGTTDANGFYLVNLPANALENGTITLILVEGFTGTLNSDLDTDNNGVFDSTPWTRIVDAVAVNDGGVGDFTYGVPVLGVAYDSLAFTPGGASRIPDGTDTDTTADWVRNDFDLAGIPGFPGTLVTGEAVNTPGVSNTTTLPDNAPFVDSTTPGDLAEGVAFSANIDITFSEPVNTVGDWFAITCTISGAHTAVVSGGPIVFTIDPTTDFSDGDACTVTVSAAAVTDQDAIDPPDSMVADYEFSFAVGSVCAQLYTPIYEIQGSGTDAAITGLVSTMGVVVGDYEGPSPTLRGFYIQDMTGDSDPTTSDGIFVFNGSNDNVDLGDVVRIRGTASEFQGQTQISASSVSDCGTGAVSPVDVTFPMPSLTYLEQFEGMLVRFPQTMYVTEHFQLGRFGQVVMSSGARLVQPTSVALPGAPALALQAANNLNKIIVDDAVNSQNPDPIEFGRGGNDLTATNTLRGGDTAANMVGVMTYTWAGNAASGNAYRLRTIGALGGGVPDFQPVNPRPEAAPAPTGTLRVAGMNVLNYFNTWDGLPDTVDNCALGVGGASTDCRGADTAAEFARQWPKTVAAILETGADIIGLGEIENDGYGPSSAIAELVDQLNTATAPGTWALIDVDAETGQINALGTDAIKVGFIYKPATVTPVGQTAVLNSSAFVNGGDGAERNRPSLAQAFEENATGNVLVVSTNHLKSKGSACDLPDAGDGQGNCNLVRTNAANLLAYWLASDPTGTGDPDVLIIGDLNSYAKEDPITTLESAGYINLIAAFGGSSAYSYVFDGQWGYLDHALGNEAIGGQVTGVVEFHINADEPSVLDYNLDFKTPNLQTILYADNMYRMSDHDPVLVDLDLNAPPDCSAAQPSRLSLWPPNGKFQTVTINGVTDLDGDDFEITVTSIFQDEPVNGDNDGNTSPDGKGVGTYKAGVRAERDGLGNGRVYHISFEAEDEYGNSCTGTVQVAVPVSNNGFPAVDDGPLYDSTLP